MKSIKDLLKLIFEIDKDAEVLFIQCVGALSIKVKIHNSIKWANIDFELLELSEVDLIAHEIEKIVYEIHHQILRRQSVSRQKDCRIKAYLAKKIIELFPPREEYLHYVEPFFGSGAVLFEHDPEGKSEVVNDLNSSLTSFWRCLQQPKLFERFKQFVEAIPFSEIEWQKSSAYLDSQPMLSDTLEQATLKEAIAFFCLLPPIACRNVQIIFAAF